MILKPIPECETCRVKLCQPNLCLPFLKRERDRLAEQKLRK